MKKRLFIVLALSMVIAGAVFATGQTESGTYPGTPWAQGFQPDLVSVTGTLSLQEGPRALLKTDKENYLLMYPYYLATDVEVKDGDKVTVEGYLLPGPRWNTQAELKALRVTKANIGGKEYDLSQEVYGNRAYAGCPPYGAAGAPGAWGRGPAKGFSGGPGRAPRMGNTWGGPWGGGMR